MSELKQFLAKLPVPTTDNSNTQKNANKAKANADKFDVEVGGVALAVFTSREFPSDSVRFFHLQTFLVWVFCFYVFCNFII